MAKLFKVDLEIETGDEVTESDLSDTLFSLIEGEETNETWSKMSLNASIVTCVSEMQDVEQEEVKNNMAVSEGRIVHYNIGEGEVRPAMVVRAWGPECVNLQVFVDGSNDLGKCIPHTIVQSECDRGIAWRTSVLQGDEPGQWNWPKRVEESPPAGA